MLVANFQEMFCDLSKWENQIPRVNEDNEVCEQRVLHRLFFYTCVFSFSGLASTRYFAVRSWGWNKLRLTELSVPMANNLLRLIVEGNLGQNPKLRLRLRLRPNPNLRRRLRVRVRGRLPERVHPNWPKLKLTTQLVPQTLQLPPSPSGRPRLPLKRCLVSPLRRSLRCREREPSSPAPVPTAGAQCFARRKRPTSKFGGVKWDAIRQAFQQKVKPLLKSYSAFEDHGWIKQVF